jgi:hypothetical protein
MNLKKWFKNQLAAAAIAFSNVEKNAFNQQSKSFDSNNKYEKRHQEGTLAFNLKQGEITQEVKNLRWRTYKVLNASQNLKLTLNSTDLDGDSHYNAINGVEDRILLSKVKLDSFDNYKLEMVVNNSEITMDSADSMGNKNLTLYDEVKKATNENGDEVASHGEINANEYFASVKCERPIKIKRDSIPRFFIENFTKKLNILRINDEERLLEFYVSKYPEELKPTSRLFVKKMSTALGHGFVGMDMFDIKEVEFITHNTLGSSDFLHYSYEILKVDKIIEFDGNYVIKFNAKIINNGIDILSDFIEQGLDKRYKNKEVKKQRI